MTDPGLTCSELVELVTDYLEGALSADDSARFERHLDACSGCSAYVEQFRETIRLAGSLRADDVTPEAREALLAAFDGWRRGRRR